MLRLSLLLLFMVAAACSETRRCALPHELDDRNVDRLYPASAPNTISPPNITDNRLYCIDAKQRIHYVLMREGLGKIRKLAIDEEIVCGEDGKVWNLVSDETRRNDHRDYKLWAASCLGSVKRCPVVDAISEAKANRKWPLSVPNKMESPKVSRVRPKFYDDYEEDDDLYLVCDGDNGIMYYEGKFGEIRRAGKLECEDGQWIDAGGKYRTNITKASCLGRTKSAPWNDCSKLKYMRKEVETKFPGKVYAKPIVNNQEAFCDDATPNLRYMARDGIRTASYLECNDGKWHVLGAKGIFANMKVYCSS